MAEFSLLKTFAQLSFLSHKTELSVAVMVLNVQRYTNGRTFGPTAVTKQIVLHHITSIRVEQKTKVREQICNLSGFLCTLEKKKFCELGNAFYGTVPASGEYHISIGYRVFM